MLLSVRKHTSSLMVVSVQKALRPPHISKLYELESSVTLNQEQCDMNGSCPTAQLPEPSPGRRTPLSEFPNGIYTHKLQLVMEKYTLTAATKAGPPRQLIEFPAVL